MRPPTEDVRAATRDAIRAQMLIHAFRVRGHTEARLDPLSLREGERHPDLDPASYGFAPEDLERPIYLFMGLGLETATLGEILATAREIYCGTLGVEFMHIQDPEAKSWIQERLERAKERYEFTDRFRKSILERLIAAESFERFLHKRFLGTKRFGLDGGESTVPALEQILLTASRSGVEEIVI
ncbi:MAG: 2-oxoglutarate dehydrogenase E1 component, partial [Myxococcota bacterium]